MTRRIPTAIFSLILLLGSAYHLHAQSEDGSSLFGKPNERDVPPKSVAEMLYRMQSEKIKKEYDELLERGQQAVTVTGDLEKSLTGAGSLPQSEQEKLVELEKLVKKIRSSLGGDDDGGDQDAEKPLGFAGNVKYMHELAIKLQDELKKSTRFSISIDAIQYTNSILRTIKSLRNSAP
jgi:hypothetical protein